MIKGTHISKRFGKIQALHDLNFSVPHGKITAIMGADGAGKTSLFNILATLDRSFQGKLTINNLDTRSQFGAIRFLIGYVPEKFSLYGDLSVEENLHFFASVYGYRPKFQTGEAQAIWESLEPFAKRRAQYLSGGMKQKLSLCCAMIHSPSLLLLDEPTTGIDPPTRMELWNIFKKLRGSGTTICISTQYLEEAMMADSVMLLHKGRQLSIDAPQKMLAAYPKTLMSVSGYPAYLMYQKLRELKESEHCYVCGDELRLVFPSAHKTEDIMEQCCICGLEKAIVSTREPDMEDVFLNMIKSDEHH